MRKKDLNGTNGIALGELIPDNVDAGIELCSWHDFLSLGTENLDRLIAYWRRQERGAKKEVDRWFKVMETIKDGTYTRSWMKEGKTDMPTHCCYCRYGTYYSDHDCDDNEIVLFACANQVDMGYTRPFTSTPIGIEKESPCILASSLKTKREKKVMANKSSKKFMLATANRERVANKIDILCHMSDCTMLETPVLPALRRTSDFLGKHELHQVTKSETGEPVLRAWYLESEITDEIRIPVYTMFDDKKGKDSIHPQNAAFATIEDIQYMWNHPSFAKRWISSIKNPEIRSLWKHYLIDMPKQAATSQEER